MIAWVILAWVLPAFAAPYSSNANMAVQWLSSHQNIDGSWGNGDTKYPCTAETVLALQAMNQRNSAYYWGIAWLENNSAQNTDYMARRILALAPHGDNVTSEMTSLQTTQAITQPGNNGWGLTSSYQGSPLDSALALLAYSQQGVTTNVPVALAYLKSSQLTVHNIDISDP
ncbi:MAG: hypothetical protein Q7U74_03610 [Saprospiraceae bacterium]|nr:hypothetical protein [Saprospiraceae bacterium]